MKVKFTTDDFATNGKIYELLSLVTRKDSTALTMKVIDENNKGQVIVLPSNQVEFIN